MEPIPTRVFGSISSHPQIWGGSISYRRHTNKGVSNSSTCRRWMLDQAHYTAVSETETKRCARRHEGKMMTDKSKREDINRSCATAYLADAENIHGEFTHREVSVALTKAWEYSPSTVDQELFRLRNLIKMIDAYRPKGGKI